MSKSVCQMPECGAPATWHSMPSNAGLTEIVEKREPYGTRRTTYAHHKGCRRRGVGSQCGCDPIIVVDYVTPREMR